MDNNNKKFKLIAVAAAIIVLIIIGFYYTTQRTAQDEFNPADESTRGNDESLQVVDVKHQYKSGVHTFAGEINLPTPCDSLEVKALNENQDKSNVKLEFTSLNTSEGCAQVISPRRFKTSIEGPIDINVTGTLDGKELRINLFEVPSNQDLDEFEINIKG